MNVDRFRVRPGARRPLHGLPTDFTDGFDGKEEGKKHLDRLSAQRQHALLVIVQGMDTAGKDSLIKHVFSGFNPQGVFVHNFKQPSSEELAHDVLWKATGRLPARGQITVFNRSYYEEVLVVRAQRRELARARLEITRKRKAGR